ncbi:MAG: DUF547 domain-containing protein [Planctomycetota bacterium]
MIRRSISQKRRNPILSISMVFLAILPFFFQCARADEFTISGYADLLSRYVDDAGMVNYQELESDRGGLDAFTRKLGTWKRADFEKMEDQAKIAFLVNAYNAFTLKAIIDHYPIAASESGSDFPANSIRQIEGVWDKLKFFLLDQEVTLNQIEHEWLRPRFDEPRIHMALVCAAVSCPPLRNEPYRAEALDAQLDDQTRRFLKHEKKFKIDRKKKAVRLSRIFSWFGKDFVKSHGTDSRFKDRNEIERAVLNFIHTYLGDAEKGFLTSGEYEIEYLHYDWTLNEQRP